MLITEAGASGCDHVAGDALGEQERDAEVDVHDAVPLGSVDVEEEAAGVDAGVVDEHVGGAPAGGDGVDEGVEGGVVGEIGGVGEAAGGGAGFGEAGIEGVTIAVGQAEAGAGAGEGVGDPAAVDAEGAGDDDGLGGVVGHGGRSGGWGRHVALGGAGSPWLKQPSPDTREGLRRR